MTFLETIKRRRELKRLRKNLITASKDAYAVAAVEEASGYVPNTGWITTGDSTVEYVAPPVESAWTNSPGAVFNQRQTATGITPREVFNERIALTPEEQDEEDTMYRALEQEK